MAKPRKSNSNPVLSKPQASSPLASGPESGNDAAKSGNNPAGAGSGSGAAASGAAVNRPSSPTPPGGPRTAIRRRAAADHKESVRNARPASTRAAGAGGSSGTMLKLYTDESPGLKVDPVVVLVLSLGFIFSVVGLHGEFISMLFIMVLCFLVSFANLTFAPQSLPKSLASSLHKERSDLYLATQPTSSELDEFPLSTT
ncbi:Arf guanine nucleotide exchange factor sbh1 [Ophidiomyces ophidiicola]|nr:Arf guanine nucleotide exchange factor sbh1 [Ophidiomyces ophidiicola]